MGDGDGLGVRQILARARKPARSRDLKLATSDQGRGRRGVGIGVGSGRLGRGGDDTGRLGRAGVGSGTDTDGRGGAVAAGRRVVGDSGSGPTVGSGPTPEPLSTGTIPPPTTSSCVPLAGLEVGVRAPPLVGEAGGPCIGPRGSSRRVATVAPPRRAPAMPMAMAIATSRGQPTRADAIVGERRLGEAAGARSAPFERIASATASARLEAPSLSNALARCQFTVLSEIPRVTAISLLVRPSATRSRISRWRGLS